MPIVNIDMVPEMMIGDKQSQYNEIVSKVTNVIHESTGAPKDSVHVLIREVPSSMYGTNGTILSNKL
ncbi:tautomerase family protein [Staphylococcus pseudoxylosus]|uniref:2-hydroxymuconate tautomerase n=1 Tax=Staphylococcus pseudoxylosus TaxID=2282419 RepID=UPI000D1E0E39|nr:2-hydroxymuconate tautomerase [Staphylococcus pseudoxylosus]PTI54618.1 hypothetical protein BU103_13615 [Staphylococcus xylosus]MDW8798722.1 2-hydroxymuconate tautomerase [Staphylococcus pseudoxylosus]MEB6035909.1 tautomerase family protein [Staphylococcus pseudoxylosus]MEB6045202.1 tautomerase family protein [Staphylococcus pseudoxylosus]MEB6059840.1 tautomerase family protein [Staphylococcus pseudoxylosus]